MRPFVVGVIFYWDDDAFHFKQFVVAIETFQFQENQGRHIHPAYSSTPSIVVFLLLLQFYFLLESTEMNIGRVWRGKY